MKKTSCPFCGNPSFVSSSSEGQYFCFSCGMGGDRISYLRAARQISYKEASQRLKTPLLTEENKSAEKEKIFEALLAAEEFFFSSHSLSKSS